MLFLYFSGTGNTKFCMEYFARKIDTSALVYSIEEMGVLEAIKMHHEIVLGYPIYYSNIPKILRDFVISHAELWEGKNMFLVATMGLFSGDGAGVMARLLKKHHANVTGGLHLKMPDCILDVEALKKTDIQNQKLVQKAKEKLDLTVVLYKNGRLPQEGLYIWSHIAGLLGQRLYFYNKTKNYTDKLKIASAKCIGCGKCALLCPMQNITMEHEKAMAHNKCTMCYRCINNCPKQAITLIGKKIVGKPFEKYD